jgi:tRNA (guanine-N7-)-methyltransferase
MYGLTLHEDFEDISSHVLVTEELKIKTYYEGLDIAQSNKIHYLRFTLPSSVLPDLDEQLHERIMNYEKVN